MASKNSMENPDPRKKPSMSTESQLMLEFQATKEVDKASKDSHWMEGRSTRGPSRACKQPEDINISSRNVTKVDLESIDGYKLSMYGKDERR